MKLSAIRTIIRERDLAMARARWCKQQGMACYWRDVLIARGFNRMLLRAAR